MAVVTTEALKRLLPKGRPLKLVEQGAQVVEALGEYLAVPRAFVRGVEAESLPGTATDTIDQWLELLGMSVPAGATLAEKRALASGALSAIGGQSLDYINAQVQAVLPNVYIEELDAAQVATFGGFVFGDAVFGGVSDNNFYYYVRGFYPFARDFVRLVAILTRTAPLHLIPIYQARNVFDGDVDRANIGICGRAICGRGTTAYVETDGQYALAGIGRAGIEICGRSIPV